MKNMNYSFLEPNNDTNKYYRVRLFPGVYNISAWGASGGGSLGGKGGFASGVFVFKTPITLYAYVGSQGTYYSDKRSPGGYNGGGEGELASGGSGGGASDVRIVSGKWNETSSLESRLVVAAGGGGSCGSTWASGGYGGGITGGNSIIRSGSCSNIISEGATQTNGELGKGANAHARIIGNCQTEGNGGGGGGYRGGLAIASTYNSGGGGGSSYVSGHPGCKPLKYLAISYNIQSGNVINRNGNGYVIINTLASFQMSNRCYRYYSFSLVIHSMFFYYS